MAFCKEVCSDSSPLFKPAILIALIKLRHCGKTISWTIWDRVRVSVAIQLHDPFSGAQVLKAALGGRLPIALGESEVRFFLMFLASLSIGNRHAFIADF